MNVLVFLSRKLVHCSNLSRQVYLSVINGSSGTYQLRPLSLLITVISVMTKLIKLLLTAKYNDDVTTWKALTILLTFRKLHCVKVVRIWSSHFLAFGLNTEIRSALRIQFKCGKKRTRITPNTDTFHAMLCKAFNVPITNSVLLHY